MQKRLLPFKEGILAAADNKLTSAQTIESLRKQLDDTRRQLRRTNNLHWELRMQMAKWEASDLEAEAETDDDYSIDDKEENVGVGVHVAETLSVDYELLTEEDNGNVHHFKEDESNGDDDETGDENDLEGKQKGTPLKSQNLLPSTLKSKSISNENKQQQQQRTCSSSSLRPEKNLSSSTPSQSNRPRNAKQDTSTKKK